MRERGFRFNKKKIFHSSFFIYHFSLTAIPGRQVTHKAGDEVSTTTR
jgi:hypothetical protein